LTAAIVARIEPGRTAIVVPPRARAGEPPETTRELLDTCIGHLARRGVRLAQALLATDHGVDAEVLIAGGFRHACDLLHLVSLVGSFPTSTPPDDLQFVSYCPAEHKRLASIVEKTYEGSLDCPQLDKLRDIEDVLAGYRAVGAFDPARWLIVRNRGSDVGCLLLADHPSSNAWELVYMGIVPAERGRGFGVALARYAQWLTGRAGRERLTVAVDAANVPATSAYAAAGFVAWDRRSVFLRAI
jgi:GNAT superfamily N-acetyltransferase